MPRTDELMSQMLPRKVFRLIYACYTMLTDWKVLYLRYSRFGTIWRQDTNIRKGGYFPWYTYPAIEYLAEQDFSAASVFEYGAGYSTFWWARNAAHVTSVEHCQGWYSRLRDKLPNNAEIIYANDAGRYVNAISLNAPYDVIVIDGKHRKNCADRASDGLSKGGIVILDDSNRYPDICKKMRDKNLIQIDFMGFAPCGSYTRSTTLFIDKHFKPKPASGWMPKSSIGSKYTNK